MADVRFQYLNVEGKVTFALVGIIVIGPIPDAVQETGISQRLETNSFLNWRLEFSITEYQAVNCF